jgi:hypothetical protein
LSYSFKFCKARINTVSGGVEDGDSNWNRQGTLHKTKLIVMKKLIVLMLCLTALEGLAQDCQPGQPLPTRPDPSGEISNQLAKTRIDLYIKKNHGRNYRAQLDFRPCGFLKLLKYITDPSKGYDGLRVYFAADVNDGDLTLIFVPTKEQLVGQYRINVDDKSSYLRIEGDNILPITYDDAVKSVRNYEAKHLRNFEADRRPDNSKFNETRSLWYDIRMFKPGIWPVDRKTGLTTYLQDLMNRNEVKNVAILFAAFEPGIEPFDYDYQLTLVLKFDGTNNVDSGRTFLAGGFEAGKLQLIKNLEDEKQRTADTNKKRVLEAVLTRLRQLGYVDTGVPCPPPPPGYTCLESGALLSGN